MDIRSSAKAVITKVKNSKLVQLTQNSNEPVTITRTFDVPVTRSEQLGTIPQDTYRHNYSGLNNSIIPNRYHHSSGGGRSIYRDVPIYSGGSPQMRTVRETLTEKPYDPKVRSLMMTGVGALAGVAGTAITSHLLGGTPWEPVAMTLSAVAGATSGFGLGYLTAAGDEVSEAWKTHDILHPRMTGYTESVRADTYTEKTNCRYEKNQQGQQERVCDEKIIVKGHWHTYSPDISSRKVGQYDRPVLEHSNWFGPLGTGALTIAGAGAIGYGIKTLMGVAPW